MIKIRVLTNRVVQTLSARAAERNTAADATKDSLANDVIPVRCVVFLLLLLLLLFVFIIIIVTVVVVYLPNTIYLFLIDHDSLYLFNVPCE